MVERVATVEIAGFGAGIVAFRLLGSEVMDQEALQFRPLEVDQDKLPPLTGRTSVAAYGTALRAALSSHEGVKAELIQIFGTKAPNRGSLRLQIVTPDGELLRWETLCEVPDRFLALNSLCSLRRIAFAGSSRESGLRTYDSPLKMAAFLSPVGISSAAEFDAIAATVAKARAKGLDIEAIVYLGEQDLLERKTADAAAGTLPGISVKPMPHNAELVANELADHPVQFAHFFCHGISEASTQLLEFASINDHDIGAEAGSIRLTIADLKDALEKRGTVWVTVLNSCSGAHAVPRLYSMARSLAEVASPVTIGMAEPISDVDATLFAESFYTEAFDIVRGATGGLQPGSVVTIDFGAAVWAARQKLHKAYSANPPDAFGRWSLPILYQRDLPLKVTRAVDPNMKARIDGVAAALRGMASTTPDDLRDGILALLDKEPQVPAALRPDRFGNVA